MRTKKHNSANSNNSNLRKTRRKNTQSEQNIQGKIINETTEGWKVLSIFGEPYERGFAHGYLLKNELVKVKKVFLFLLKNELKVSYSTYMRDSNRIIKPIMRKEYPEYYEEIKGISHGAKKAGLDISVNFLIGWNAYVSLYSYYKDGAPIKCSAFIATGNHTEDGDIVMAHNTHTSFAEGFIANIVLYVFPTQGYSFVMQTSPGYIASIMDWFICSSGMIGCETTIGDINYKPKFGDPVFCRIRKAMQYGNDLDDYDKIMTTRNAGDYACSWLFGDIRTNEIMLFELGLKEKHIKKTKNGAYYGMNSAIGENIRNKETNDKEHTDITTSVGARNVRFKELIHDKYKGKINMKNAKEIICDHYDKHLNKNQMGARCICKHGELAPDGKNPYHLYGCTDAKIVNSRMAKKLMFLGRFGSACGRPFSIKKHVKEHPEYKEWVNVIDEMPSYNWTTLSL